MTDDEEDYEIEFEGDGGFHDYEDDTTPAPAPVRPLKGRKRFLADLEDMKKRCEVGFNWHGYDLKSTYIFISV